MQRQGIIKEVKLQNKKNAIKGTPGGNDTTDKVFCLSLDEVAEYFADDKDRVAIPTEYAKSKVLKEDMDYFLDESSGGGRWRLRSPGRIDEHAADVFGSGWVYPFGSPVDGDGVGIRPALWINLDS